MISCSSSFASSTPATSLNVTFFCELDDSFALLLPNDSALLPPLCIWRMKKIQKPIISRTGRPRVQQRGPRAGGRLLRVHDHAAIDQLVDQAFVLGRRVGVERLAVLGDAGDVLPGDVDACDIVPASACDMKSLNMIGRSCCWSFVEKFQISTPTTTSTIQNSKLFNVEFTQSLPKA